MKKSSSEIRETDLRVGKEKGCEGETVVKENNRQMMDGELA